MGGADFYSLGAFWLLETQQFFGPDAYSIARIITAFGFAFLIGIFLISWGIDLTRGSIRELFLITSCLMTAGIGGMLVVTQLTPSMAIGLSFLGSLGVGGLYIPPVIALTIISPDDLIGTIIGLALSIRFIGGQVGYTISFNILQTKLTEIIPSIVGTAIAKAGLPITEIPAFILALVESDFTAIAQIKGVTPAVLEAANEAVSVSYLEGFKLVYYVGIGFGGAAIIASLFLGNIRRYVTDRVAVDIH
jgi:hypothetical protein